MAGTMADESKNKLLLNRLSNPPFTTLEMGLSEANITPDHATVASDLTTNEVSVAGYARQAISGWSAPALTPDFKSRSNASPVTFVNTGGVDSGTIYCWFWIDTATGNIVEAGRYALPFVLVATVGTYTTTPYDLLTGDP